MPDFYMVQARLDPGRVFALCKRRGLPLRDVDLGYAVHCMLGELFGDLAPKPFSLRSLERTGIPLELLGYATAPAEQLRGRADAYAEPELHAGLDWSTFASKQMPETLPTGRVGFELRACPVVRKSTSSEKHRAGAEVDAFVDACWRETGDVSVSREEVYREWLGRQLENSGASLLRAELAAFRLNRVTRRTHETKRSSDTRRRPDALFRGTLEVKDGSTFLDAVHRGIGRHRAFGFGMLLLRPER